MSDPLQLARWRAEQQRKKTHARTTKVREVEEWWEKQIKGGGLPALVERLLHKDTD